MPIPLFLLFPLVITCTSPTAAADRPTYACRPPHHNHHPFCNTTLPIPARARSLVSLLTLQEKSLLLSDTASAVPRLGIPSYEWWSESLHGVAANGPGVSFTSGGPVHSATGFPQVILAAAAFNRTLWFEVARAVAVEARAMYNVGQAGLTFWAPNVNVFRDPRWGRGQETPGEDPVVAGEYAVAYVRGFQGVAEEEEEGRRVLEQKGGRLMVSACCKHYTAYDLEKWGNFTRYAFNAKVTEQDMEDSYQPPFHSCIKEGRASCLMCSYNEVNGVPMCADHALLQKARDEWGFQGYITSDCNAVATIFEYQNYTSSAIDAVALALKAGVDINCGGYYTLYTKPALEYGKIVEDDIDQALHNLFTVQLRLGFFDGDPAHQQYGKLGPDDVCTTKHKKLALEAVRQGIVLLKNDKDLLPLSRRIRLLLRTNSPEVRSLAVIGPIADNSSKLNGDYSGVPCEEKSLVDAFKVRIPNVSFVAGCTDGVLCESTEGFQEAMQIAGEVEQVVLVVGLDLEQEGEDLDRVSLLLPGNQVELVTAVSSVSRNPVVLVLVSGGPLDVSFAQEDPKVGSIIWVGYPGEAGAQATVEVIFGDYNPGGRLPVTWYPEGFTSVPMDDMHMRPDPSRGYPGRTYRFHTGPVLYEFGHGLSYTIYSHAFISAPERISFTSAAHLHRESAGLLKSDGLDYVVVDNVREYCDALNFVVNISVRNEGRVSGSHVVLLFSRSETRVRGAPKKQLIGFERLLVASGEAANATILVKPCTHMSTADEKGDRILRFGGYVLLLESGIEHSLAIEA